MKKQLLILGIFAALMTGCQQSEMPGKKAEVSLSKAELIEIKDSFEEIRLNLIKKSILKEMAGEKYSKKEKKELENIKEDIEIEYFLNKKAMENVKVDDQKVLQIYHENFEALKQYDINQALILIKDELTKQQLYIEKVNYVSSLEKKYNIGETIKKYIETEEKPQEKTEEKPQEKTEEKTQEKTEEKTQEKTETK